MFQTVNIQIQVGWSRPSTKEAGVGAGVSGGGSVV